jgi:hypothetical protein
MVHVSNGLNAKMLFVLQENATKKCVMMCDNFVAINFK